MKKFYIASGAFALYLLGSGLTPKSLNARMNGTNFGANYSGISGPTCNTSGCHTGGAVNSGPGSLSITDNIPPAGYTAGTQYSISLTVSAGGANGAAYGFAFSGAQEGHTTSINGFAAADGSTLAKSNGAYIVHNTAAAGGGTASSHTFTFNWTAPPAGTGNVKFFAAGNSANGNGESTGDQIYTTSIVVPEAPGTAGLTEAVINAFELFPNPATEQVSLNIPAHLSDGTLRVLDMTGKTVFNTPLHKEQLSIDLGTFAQGTYIVEIRKNGKSYHSRLLKN